MSTEIINAPPGPNVEMYVLALEYLPPLEDYPNRETVALVAAYMATFGPKPGRIARAMGCHRNTASKWIKETRRVLAPLRDEQPAPVQNCAELCNL